MSSGQIGNLELVKQLNGAAVYRLIDQHGPISRIQIADVSQLAPASVTKITRQLLEQGLVKEVAQQASTGGRRAISLTTSVESFHSIAIRIDRDDIQLSIYDLGAKLIANKHYHFAYQDENALVAGLITHVKRFITTEQNKIDRIIAIGITLSGLIDPITEGRSYMPNINIDKLKLAKVMNDEFAVECFIGNDTRSLALAEHYFGASQDCLDSILVSVHQGTSAGIIVNGQVFLSSNHNVGEIGHIQIDPLGSQCQCGNLGCLETVTSNPAVIKHIEQLIEQGHNSSLAKLTDISIFDVCQHALNGDKLATQSIVTVGELLGKVIAITVNLFNPQKIVIAGDITHAQEILFPAIRRNVEHQSLASFHTNLPIVASQLNKQPTLGAFAMVKSAMLNGILLQKLLEV